MTPEKILIPFLAVIPISTSSGLIQWVEHATPLFTTYKAWQRNVLAAQAQVAAAQTMGRTGGSSGTANIVAKQQSPIEQ